MRLQLSDRQSAGKFLSLEDVLVCDKGHNRITELARTGRPTFPNIRLIQLYAKYYRTFPNLERVLFSHRRRPVEDASRSRVPGKRDCGDASSAATRKQTLVAFFNKKLFALRLQTCPDNVLVTVTAGSAHFCV